MDPAIAFEAWRALPHTHADIIANGRWKPYPYLTIIGHAVVDAIVEGGGLIVVNLPPRHGKSEFISFHVPLWALDTWPEKRIIHASYGASLSEYYGRRVRNALMGESNKTITKVKQDTKDASDWQTVEGGGMICAGVGGPITGKGGDLIIIDDPVKDWLEADSETIQQRNIDWFRTTLWPRREPGAVVILLMTRWHRKDLAGFVLSDEITNALNVKPKHIRFPAISESTNDILGRMPGEALCPERYDEQALLEIRKVSGPRHWAGLYQQTPIDDDSAMVKRHWFQYYTEMRTQFKTYITIDLAFSLKKSADYVVLMNSRLDVYGGLYVWEYMRGRYPINDFINALFDMVGRAVALELVGIEIPPNETEENNTMGRIIKDEMARRQMFFRLVPKRPVKDKVTRAQGFVHRLGAGKVFLKKGMTELEDELLNFPTGDHDDLVDTLSLVDELVKPVPPKHGRPLNLPPSAMSA